MERCKQNRFIRSDRETYLYSDHSAVILTIDNLPPKSNFKNPLWKLNTSFLDNPEYIVLVKNTMQNARAKVPKYENILRAD